MMEEKTFTKKQRERKRKGHFPIYGWLLTGNWIDRQSGLEDGQTGQEEGDKTGKNKSSGLTASLFTPKHSEAVVAEAAMHITRLTVRSHP